MFPFLFVVFGMMKNVFSIFNIDNLYLFVGMAVAFVILIVTLITYGLQKFGFGKDVVAQVNQDAKTFSFQDLFSEPVNSDVVKEEEKHKYPIPGKKNEYYEFRMDMGSMKKFGKDGFMDALSYTGLLPE